MFKKLIFLLLINFTLSDPIIFDIDDDDDISNYNLILNFYNDSNCGNNFINSINYYDTCNENKMETCCQYIMNVNNLTDKYNLTEECAYNDYNNFYTTYQCIEINNKSDFDLIFTIFYVIFSIFFIILICYCFKRNNYEKKKNNIEMKEREPLTQYTFDDYI